METTMNLSFIYGIIAVLSLILSCGYCVLVRKKENCIIWLYFSVFIANLGYFTLSISKTLEEALLANRIAYLGCVILPLFMLMTIMKVCKMSCSKGVTGIFIAVSCLMFLIVASQGYLDYYYEEVSLVFVGGMAKLQKTYGPLHGLYGLYLFSYFAIMIGTIIKAVIQKKIASFKNAGLLVIIVFLNMTIWLVEQLINWDFEFLSVSYVASELLLLFLYGMIQDYEIAMEQMNSPSEVSDSPLPAMEQVVAGWPEISRLSAREREVLKRILEDKKRKEIAEELCITENTVKKHISSIFSKLGVANRNELLMRIINK